MQALNVMNAPKTGTFQMRINPEIKAQVEQIYEKSGLTLTDAINCFLQQSINVGGLPFVVTQNSQEALRKRCYRPVDGGNPQRPRFSKIGKRLGL